MSTPTIDSPPAPAEAPIPTFTVTMMVRRFNPEVDEEPRWQDFDVRALPHRPGAGCSAQDQVGAKTVR